MTKVVYQVFNPQGSCIKTFSSRKEAKAFIEGLNWNIPSWHYTDLYKYRAITIKS